MCLSNGHLFRITTFSLEERQLNLANGEELVYQNTFQWFVNLDEDLARDLFTLSKCVKNSLEVSCTPDLRLASNSETLH